MISMTLSMQRTRKNRLGNAVIELAVCLPAICAVVFGSIEACNMIAVKQIIAESAYDGALAAIRQDATEADVLSDINAVLAARNVTPSSVRIEGPTGGNFNSAQHGDFITVTVEVLTDGNVAGPQLFGLSTTLVGKSSAIKQ